MVVASLPLSSAVAGGPDSTNLTKLDRLKKMSLEELFNQKIDDSGTLIDTTRRYTPAVVTRITAEDVRVSGARDLDELLEIYVPNLQWVDHQQLKQTGLTITNGETYRITFDVKADSARTVRADVMQNSSPYTNYGQQTFNLTTSLTEYSFDFTMDQSTDTNSRFRFVFGDDTPDLTFDNVDIEEL